MKLFNIYEIMGKFYKNIFFNINILDIIKKIDNNYELILKALIYNRIDLLFKSELDPENLFTFNKKTININFVINIINQHKPELDYIKLTELLLEIVYNYDEFLIIDNYIIHGYLVLNNYDVYIDKIKNIYTDNQIIILIKKIYSDLLFNIFNKYIKIWLSCYKNINDIDDHTHFDKLINDLSIYINECNNKYDNDISLL